MENSLFKQKSFIGGHWVSAKDDKTFPVYNPATGKVVKTVSDCSALDAEKATVIADEAYQSFKKRTALERADYLYRWFNLLIQHEDELAEIITLESGKPLVESKAEVRYGASFVQWFAEEAKRINGSVLAHTNHNKQAITIKQPVGVCSAITPWNFPLAMITRKCAPAIAAGCTLVVKPAKLTPLTALACAELADRAGIPDGVFNVVPTAQTEEVGRVLSTHPLIRKISFTGSTHVGKLLLRQSADSVKRVSMELGGNAPFIVFDDADLDLAVEGALASKYRNSGQTCICVNRFLVQSGIYDAFADAMVLKSQQLIVGDGMTVDTQVGPLISQQAIDKVEALVDDAIQAGAIVLTGGQLSQRGGNYYEPTVLANVTDAMGLAHEEIFAPVVALYRFETEEDAIRLANNTQYGLASYVYSQDIARVWRMAERLEYGMVGINETGISNTQAPFGGIKESGLGREGGAVGIDEYLEIKYLCLGH